MHKPKWKPRSPKDKQPSKKSIVHKQYSGIAHETARKVKARCRKQWIAEADMLYPRVVEQARFDNITVEKRENGLYWEFSSYIGMLAKYIPGESVVFTRATRKGKFLKHEQCTSPVQALAAARSTLYRLAEET